MKPFLKWVGGKRWLTHRYGHLLVHPYERYIEPFLGGGAVFFHMEPKRSILSDLNQELVNLYTCIRDDHESVQALLRHHARRHDDAYYYSVRGRKFRSANGRAAQLLYLNRTCWNGLYRQNLKGEFNVPRGTKNAVLMDDDNFEEAANLLKRAVILPSDFEEIILRATSGDFVFIDPPYTVRHNANGFIKYNESIFSWQDQQRLAKVLAHKARSGATFLMTNAFHSSVTDLYAGFSTIIPAERASVLSADSKYRGRTKEALILIGDGWRPRFAELNAVAAIGKPSNTPIV